MPKINFHHIDVFALLKGGVRGYSHPSLQIRNVSAKGINNMVFNPTRHIPEYANHIKICKHFYDNGIYNAENSNMEGKITSRVKNYEYAFFTESYKKVFAEENLEGDFSVYESKNVGFLSCWANYIALIKNDCEINENTLKDITDNLKTTNFKPVIYALTNVNDGNNLRVDETIKTHKIKTIFDLISSGYIDMELTVDNLYFSKDDGIKMSYLYGKKGFNHLSIIEKVCTIFTMYLGKLHTDSLKGDDKEKRVAIIKKRNIEGIIKTVRQTFKPFIQKIEVSDQVVNISDIIKYFEDNNNHQKIMFDLLIGSFLKKSIKLNTLVSEMGISIKLDDTSLLALNTININDITHHFTINEAIQPDALKRIYTLKATRYFKGIDIDSITTISNFKYFVYLCFYSNIMVPEVTDMPLRPTCENDIMDKVIKDINTYFRQKDNHLHRKQEFFKTFDGDWKSLVDYRNRISNKETSLDSDLMVVNVPSVDLKRVVFNTFFTY